MTDKHFNAICAKNAIAHELKNYASGHNINFGYVKARLKEIELYIGEGNQPSVESIIPTVIERGD
jgi:hypothetical protein